MDDRPRIPSRLVLAFYVIMGGGAALFSHFALHRNAFRPFPQLANRPLIDLLLGIGIGLVAVGLSQILDRFFEWSRAMTRMFRDVLGPIRPVDALIIAFASGIGEEVLFRGVLLPTTGLVASSLIFGLVHGFSPARPAEMWRVLRRFAPLVMIATGLGFAFGLAVEYTGNILVAVVAHFTINFLNLSKMYQQQWTHKGDGDTDG